MEYKILWNTSDSVTKRITTKRIKVARYKVTKHTVYYNKTYQKTKRITTKGIKRQNVLWKICQYGHGHGHMDIRTYGHTDMDIQTYGHMDIWTFRHMDLRTYCRDAGYDYTVYCTRTLFWKFAPGMFKIKNMGNFQVFFDVYSL
jgi:hypothetical protein